MLKNSIIGAFMKISVDKKNFKQALISVKTTVATRSTLPILNNIYINATENTLTLSSTNLECSTSINIGAVVSQNGEITLPASLLSDIVSVISSNQNNEIIIETNDENHTARVICGQYNYIINGIPGKEFHEYLPKFNSIFSFSILGSNLKEMITMAHYAVSTDESKPSLMGAKAEIKNNNFRLVATDSTRLVVVNKTIENNENTDESFLIPGRALNDIKSIIEDSQSVNISLNDQKNMVCFEIENIKFFARLLEGDFPEYESVIPNNSPINVKIDNLTLREGIDGIMPIARDSANIIKLNIENNNIKLEATSSEHGAAQVNVLCDKQGNDLEINFNGKYILEALKSISHEKINIAFNSALTPCLIEPIDGSKEFYWVIMPIRSI